MQAPCDWLGGYRLERCRAEGEAYTLIISRQRMYRLFLCPEHSKDIPIMGTASTVIVRGANGEEEIV